MDKPNYFAILTAKVRYDKSLTANSKLLYAEITALTNMNGRCHAGDKYFQDLFGVSRGAVQKWLKQLEDNGYIRRVVKYKDGSKQIEHRYTTIVDNPIVKKEHTPILQMLTVNNNLTGSSNNTLTESNTNLVGFVDWWNSLANTYKLANIEKVSPQRKKSLNARIADAGGLQPFQDQIKTAISNSDHLVGKNDREWKADFDWLIKPDNYVKVIEGKYNRKGSGGHAITRYGDTQQLFIHHIQDDFKAVAKQLQGANAKDFLVQFYVDAKNSGVKLTHEAWLTKIKEKGQTYAK